MTVRNFRSRLREKWQYITPDGLTYELHDPPDRSVLFYEGDGFAPLTYETTRGPFQHGQNVVSYRLDARKLDMIIRHNGCSREDYWQKRGTLTDFLRYSRMDANNPTPSVLRRILANGNIRDLDVYLNDPPVFVFPSRWDHFSLQEKIQFTAYNPIAYDPTQRTLSISDFTPVFGTDLRFPFSAPFLFGAAVSQVVQTLTIPYLGNWEEYPTVVVQGPGQSILIAHQETGARIELSGYTFGATETITFNLNYGFKTVTNNFGVSLLGYITDASDLTQFNLLPDPLVAGGLNHLDCTVGYGSPATSVLVTYKNRYMSIN